MRTLFLFLAPSEFEFRMQTSLGTAFRNSASYNPYRWRAISNVLCARPQQHRMIHSSFWLPKCSAYSNHRVFPVKKYTKEHELVNFDDSTGVGIISITDHAQSVLGDVVFVELPKVGTEVAQGGMYRPHALFALE